MWCERRQKEKREKKVEYFLCWHQLPARKGSVWTIDVIMCIPFLFACALTLNTNRITFFPLVKSLFYFAEFIFIIPFFLPAEMSHGSRNELGDGNNKHARMILKCVFINSFILLCVVVLRNTRNSYSLDEVHIFAVCERSSVCVCCVYHIKYMPSYRFFSSFVQPNVFNVFILRESHSTRRRPILFSVSFLRFPFLSAFLSLTFVKSNVRRCVRNEEYNKIMEKIMKFSRRCVPYQSIPSTYFATVELIWNNRNSFAFSFSWKTVRTYSWNESRNVTHFNCKTIQSIFVFFFSSAFQLFISI